MKTRTLDYTNGGKTCEAFVAEPEAGKVNGAAVVVFHAWGGQDDFAREKAKKLAELGYVGFAADVYGKGRRGSSPAENSQLMQPFLDDRAYLKSRLLAAVEAAKTISGVDHHRIGAIGFCFGGLCCIDVARANPEGVKGVVSFHGLLNPPSGPAASKIDVKVLVLHGWDDPLATPESVVAFGKEMTAAKADWQLHAYGGTSHAFTNPQAKDPSGGMQYNPAADKRSWQSMVNFFAEVL